MFLFFSLWFYFVLFIAEQRAWRKCGGAVFEMSSSLILQCSGALTHSERSAWDRCQFHDPVMACGVIFEWDTDGKRGEQSVFG